MRVEFERVSYACTDGTLALHDVSLRIEPGNRVAIAGVNGSGKTTLLKHLIGLLKPTQGVVRVGGEDTQAKTVAQLARRVGLAFQNVDEQLFCRTVREEVAFGVRNIGLDAARVDEALAMFGLSEHAPAHPYDLEPFQRRLIAIASVVAMNAPILALDEPTLGQDDGTLDLIAEALDELHGQGKTILVVSHNLDFCAEHFERFILMNEGHILMDGPAQAVLSRYDAVRAAQLDLPQLARLSEALGQTIAALTVRELIQTIQENKP